MTKDSLSNLEYTKFTLPNGLTCILYNREEIHSVQVNVSIDVGSLDEENSNNGISHLIEHIAFEGTEELKSHDELERFSNNIAGKGNASTSNDSTEYYGTYPSQYLEESLYYYSQMIFFPLHKEESINKEKTIIYDEITRGDDDVDNLLYKTLIKNRYKKDDTQFSSMVIGVKEILEKLNRKEIRSFYEKYYVPDNITIYIVGNLNIDKTKQLLNKYFFEVVKDRKFTKSPDKRYYTKYPEYSDFKIFTKQKLDVDQYYLSITFPTLEYLFFSQRERRLLSFLESNTASSQYQQSILWKRLREELGLVYGVGMWRDSYLSRALSEIQSSFNPDHLETVLTEIYNGINLIKEGKISDEVFKSIVKNVNDTQLMRLDSAQAVLNWIAFQENELKYHNDYITPKQYIDMVNNFKFEEVISLANKVFDWSKVNIGLVTKDNEVEVKKRVEKIWKKITSSKSKKTAIKKKTIISKKK